MAAPTPTSTRAASRRARLALVVALAGLALLAACSTISTLADLMGDLEDAGFTDVSANVDRSDTGVLAVSADAPDDATVEEAQDQAAEVVWTRFPRRFEGLRVSIDGEDRRWTYDQLEDELGARPDGLDTEGDLGDDVNRIAVVAIVGTLVAGVLGVAVVGLIVYLVVRSSRRNAASRPPRQHPQPWMPPGVPSGPGLPPSGAGPGAPVPPPGGWAPVGTHPGVPPAPGAPSPFSPPTPTAPSLAKVPPTGPPAPTGRRPRDPDARRLGRRPRGPAPDKGHTPPGWG